MTPAREVWVVEKLIRDDKWMVYSVHDYYDGATWTLRAHIRDMYRIVRYVPEESK